MLRLQSAFKVMLLSAWVHVHHTCVYFAGLFVFAYCFYYHMARSGFSSFMQLSRYYGYMAMVCYAVFLMLASVGFMSSMAFVRLIYRSIKSD
jgi:transmembrane 9 superfamily member 1